MWHKYKMRLGSGGGLGKSRLANSTVQIWSLWEPINVITKDNARAMAILEDYNDRTDLHFLIPFASML